MSDLVRNPEDRFSHDEAHLSGITKNLSSRCPSRSVRNWAVQPHRIARCLKFWVWAVEGLYYLCSKNKGTDQLHGYHAANLCLCFHICKKQVYP